MSRPRGPKRVDRPEDRAELIALAYDARRRFCEMSMRLPFGVAHYKQLYPVIHELVVLLETLGEEPLRTHSIACNPPGFRREE